MPADGMRATGSPTEIRHSRLGSSVQSLTEPFDNGKTIVSIGSKPT